MYSCLVYHILLVRVFLADLELCSLDPVAVAECFVKHSKGFVIYTDYCTNYPRYYFALFSSVGDV